MMQLLEGHTKDVRAVAYQPDGRLVSGGSDGTVRIWNPATGENTHTIKARTPVYAIAVAPNGESFAYAGRHPGADADTVPIHVYRTSDGTSGVWFSCPYQPPPPNYEQYFPRGIPRSIWSMSYSTDGRTLAVAGRTLGGANFPNGGGGHWFDAVGGTINGPLASRSIYSLRFAPTGESLAVTADSVAEFYKTCRDPEPVVSYKLPSQWAASIAIIPNSPLAVVGVNSALHFVDATKKSKPRKVKTGFRTVTGLAVAPDGRSVIACGKPDGAEVYAVDSGTKLRRYDFGLGGVHAVAVAPDGCTFALAGDHGVGLFDWE